MHLSLFLLFLPNETQNWKRIRGEDVFLGVGGMSCCSISCEESRTGGAPSEAAGS